MAAVEKSWNHGLQRGHGIRSLIEQRNNRLEERRANQELRHFLSFGEPSEAFFPAKKRKLASPKPEDIRARMELQDKKYIELESTGELTPSWLKYGIHHKERILAKMHSIRNNGRELRPASEPSLPTRVFP